MRISRQLKNLISGIRLTVFDFDGVFTDNAVWVSQDGSELVRCWRGDGLGLSRLMGLGVKVIVLSTEENPVVAVRCRKLKVPAIQGIKDKEAELGRIARRWRIPFSAIAYVGNDINDAACLRRVGVPVVVGDAHPDVLPLGRIVTGRPGGHGAVREVCDLFASVMTKGGC